MFKNVKIMSIITIFAILVSSLTFTAFAENKITEPITVTSTTPYIYELENALTAGRHKITTSFDVSTSTSVPEQDILVKDSSNNTICGLKIAPVEKSIFSVMVGSEEWIIHTGEATSGSVSGLGIYTLDMILDVDNKTVEYTLSGDENVGFKESNVFYGYFKLDADRSLTTKRPIPLESEFDIKSVSFSMSGEGTSTVKSLDIADAQAATADQTTVTYAKATDTWSGGRTITALGLDESYSYGCIVTNQDATSSKTDAYKYTFKYENDGITIDPSSTAKDEVYGITKKIDKTNLIGDELIIKTSFYSDGEDDGIGFGTAVRLYAKSQDTKPSFAFCVGDTLASDTAAAGIGMRWNGAISSSDFGKEYTVLNRDANNATLDANKWYDLTLAVNIKTGLLTAKLEWDVEKGTETEYAEGFTTKEGLVVENGKAVFTKSSKLDYYSIDRIELLQSTVKGGKAASSKFKEVWTNAGVSVDEQFNIASDGQMGKNSTYTTKITSCEPTEVVLFRACYDSDGKMKWLEMEKNVIVGTTTFGRIVNKSGEAKAGGDTVKLFLFGEGVRPLTKNESREFPTE